MKNEHDDVRDEDQELRAKLCAVLLGDADDNVRAEIDAALANSAELRAERTRLEATIGLVSSALKDDAAGGSELSPSATGALQAAAAKRVQPDVWFRTSGFRIAASFALFASVVMAWKASMSTPTNSRALGEVAVALKENEKDARNDSLAKKTEAPAAPAAAAPVPSVAANNASAADAGASLNFEQPAPAAGEITGRDLLVVDGVEAAVVSQAVTAQGRAKNLEQWGSRLLPASEPARDAGIYNFDPASQLGAVVSRQSVPLSGGAEGQDGSALPSDSSSHRAEPATPGGKGGGGLGQSGGVARTSAVAIPGKSSGASALTSGGGPSSPGPAGTVMPARASEEKLDEGSLRRLRELGYVSDEDAEDEEVLGGEVVEPGEVVTGSDDFFLGVGERKRQLEPDWRARFEHFRYACRVRPNERPRDMFFRFWGDNPFELAALDKLSTFSADVDTSSYTIARKYLVDGILPEKAQIRTEEFVNYFKGDVPPPSEGTFRIATELAPSLFGDASDQWMLRVAIRGRDVTKNERQPLALTFVIDVSGSMKEGNRLELVKHALRMLVGQLDARDSIALVKFSTAAELVLPMTAASQKSVIESAIHPLQPDGSTNTEAGLRMGYELAAHSLAQNTTNRVVLLTDGVANVGIVDPNALVAMVESQRKAGIYLNTVGVGMDNHNDNLLEQLADKGDGLCNYVDDEREVRRALVDNFTGAFEPIARDVKIQVEFDPAQVERYRLLGYENRAIADVDFRNDKVDAGEINAGHQVVALYELVRRGNADGPLATVRLRYKPPFKAGVAGGTSDESIELAQPVQAKDAAGSFTATTAGYRRSVLVAQFAEFLRRSIHARYDSLDRLIDEAKKLGGEMKDAEFDEFVAMLTRSRELVLRELELRRAPTDRCYDELRHRAYLLQQIDELERRHADANKLEELDRAARDLDRQLDELRTRLEALQGQVDDATLSRIQAENIELQRRLIELLERARASNVK